MVHRQRNAGPPRQQPLHKNPQFEERRPTLKRTMTTMMTLTSWCIQCKNNRKSITAHKYITTPRIITSSSICTQFQYRRHKVGFINYFPCATTCSCLPPPPEPCVTVFVTQGRSKFLIQNCPFRLLLNFSKSKFPFFGIFFASKFNT